MTSIGIQYMVSRVIYTNTEVLMTASDADASRMQTKLYISACMASYEVENPTQTAETRILIGQNDAKRK